jgi:hypothetical protein
VLLSWSQGAEIKLPSGAGAEIKNETPAPDPFHFIKDLEEIFVEKKS